MRPYLAIDSPSTLQTGMDILEIFAEAAQLQPRQLSYEDFAALGLGDYRRVGIKAGSRTFKCIQCGQEVEHEPPRRRHRKYCSKSCKNKFFRSR